MKILAFESSAKAASAAIYSDGAKVAEYFQNCGLTHSATLLKMAENMLENCSMTIKDIDVFAAAHGPGSFTGLRIGVSACKGLAWAEDKPCIGISTLEAMAYCAAVNGFVCAVMDARRNQFYNALFDCTGNKPVRLCEDRAIDRGELLEELRENKNKFILVGDGAQLCYNYLKESGIDAILPPEGRRMQSAWGVALSAADKLSDGGGVSADMLTPVYLRLPQAERERLERLKQEKNNI